MIKNWFSIALINFFVAACLGALMRFAFVEEVPWMKFQNVLHAHSHVAMLGWVYLGLYALIVKTFLPDEKQKAPFYSWLFWLTQGAVIGMLVTFPRQGYAFGSILFSSLHVIFSYLFFSAFFKDIKGTRTNSAQFIRVSLLFMVLSTFALWAMGPIMVQGLQGKPIYYAAVQFYLHFQFNGWFIFAILGLFFRHMELKNIELPLKFTRTFYHLLLISCLLTYVLAVTWSTPIPALFWINSAGVTIQFLALIYFFKAINVKYAEIRALYSNTTLYLMRIAFYSFLLKILVQTAVVIPYIATIGYTIRNYVIGFLHLMLLGMVTHFILAYGNTRGLVKLFSVPAKIGVGLLSAGFILSELILAAQGTMFWGAMGFIPKYYEVLFWTSALMPAGILVIIISQKGFLKFSNS